MWERKSNWEKRVPKERVGDMRLSRTGTGRLQLDLLDGPDFDVARRVARAIATAFGGKMGLPLNDIDGTSWLDIELMGGTVTVHVNRNEGVSVFALDESSDGIIHDIANYLGACGKEMGIDTTFSRFETV